MSTEKTYEVERDEMAAQWEKEQGPYNRPAGFSYRFGADFGRIEGIREAIEALRSRDSFEYWRKCGNAEIVKGMIVVPNKNDWAVWLEQKFKKELGL